MEFIVRYISCSSQSGRQSWRMSLGKSRNHGSCKDSGSRNQWTHRWSFQGVTIRMEHPQLSSVLVFRWPGVPGASVQNSARGKGHEEGGLAYAKAGLSLRRPPILEHLPPKPESAYFTALCSHLHLWLYRGLSPTASLEEGVNLQLQSIKIPGCDKSVSTYKLLWRFSSLPEQVHPTTCDCSQPPNHERHEML